MCSFSDFLTLKYKDSFYRHIDDGGSAGNTDVCCEARTQTLFQSVCSTTNQTHPTPEKNEHISWFPSFDQERFHTKKEGDTYSEKRPEGNYLFNPL